VRSFIATDRQPETVVGLTQASSVSERARSSDGESGIVTQLDEPLNDSALPNFPAAQVVLAVVPLFPFPELSPIAVPLFSSKA
jgi:hypothetical protein